ncbi:MAG: hypothetical protein WAK31_15345 [Chthoniobacterales bacterium]
MKPIVIQLQEDLTIGNKTIAEQLRTAKLISAKLELPLVEDWIQHELEGYPPDPRKLPKYRFISGGELQFRNPMHGWIPAMGTSVITVPIFQPVAEIEAYNEGDHLYLQPATKYRLTDLHGDGGLMTRAEKQGGPRNRGRVYTGCCPIGALFE